MKLEREAVRKILLSGCQAMLLLTHCLAFAQGGSPPTSPAQPKGWVETWGPIITAGGALIGVFLGIRSNKKKDLEGQRRESEVLKACLVSDIRRFCE
jgi:hypothetical protein